MGMREAIASLFAVRTEAPVSIPTREADDEDVREAVRAAMQGEEKQFDWNHYREVSDSQSQAWADEFDISPTIRVLKASYGRESVVYKGVNAIARQFQTPRFQLQRVIDDKGNRQPTIRSGIIDLLTNPQFEAPQKFHATNIIELVTAGNVFLWATPDGRKILRLPSERMRLKIENGYVIKYIMDRSSVNEELVDTGNKYEFTADEIIHIALPNPFSRYVGLSMIVAQSLPILTQKYGREHILGFFARGGHNSLVLKSTLSNGEQLIRMFKSIALAFSGRRNQWGDKILPNGVDVAGQPMKFSEIMLDKIFDMSERDIIGALGVPPVEIGVTDGSNYANAEAQRKSFYLNCIIPLSRYYCSGLQYSPLAAKFGINPSDILEIDFSHIPWLAETERKLGEGLKMKESGVVLANEIRMHLGLVPLDRFMGKLPLELAAEATMPDIFSGNTIEAATTAPAALPPIDAAVDPSNVETSPDISLNGAQIAAIMELLTAVANGQLPRESAIALIETAFALPREVAERIMGEVGAGFTPAPPPGLAPAANEPAPVAAAVSPLAVSESATAESNPHAPGEPGPTVTPATPVTTTPATIPEGDDPEGNWKRTEGELQDAPVRVNNAFIAEFAAWEQIISEHMSDKEKAAELIHARAPKFAKRLAEIVSVPMRRAYDNQYARVLRAAKGKRLKALFAGEMVGTKDAAAEREARLAGLRERARSVMAEEIAGIYEGRFVGYSDTLMERAYTLIEEGLTAGENNDTVASNLRRFIGEFYEGQALTIVRTEYGAGVAHAQSQFGADVASVAKTMTKRWLSKLDAYTRTDEDLGAGNGHAELDDQTVSGESGSIMDQSFQNGLRYPKDPKGDASSVINCRCSIAYEVDEWTD